MTFLFRDGDFKSKMRFILKATYQHSRNLAVFVTLYKSLLLVQRKMNAGKEEKHHAFVAGLIGGYMVFGENNNINNQINLYLFSRITFGVVKLLAQKYSESTVGVPYKQLQNDPRIFAGFGALTWAIVMYLFRNERETLQQSLQASMQYLYNDSDVWTSLKNFLVYNK